MSYQVLARTWRPRSFAAVAGQAHVIKVLSHALETGHLHHAYLFSGTRGVGKTTLARVLAKCMNCEQGVSPVPCGECGACREIDDGRFPDLIEVDAASRAKVEETRELMSNVQYKPVSGRFKIYLIDEVHMFSNHSFNALLKTLEEPPPHVKFLLATTEPKKVPVTVLSRCLQLNLRHLSVNQIMEQLRTILEAESVAFDDNCLRLVASAARGSMRDALSLVDQAISHGAGALQEAQIRSMLGTVDHDNLSALTEALISADGLGLLQALRDLGAFGPDYFVLLAELQSLLQKAAVVQLAPNEAEALAEHEPLVRRLADGLDQETVQLYYQLCLRGQQDLGIAPDLASGFEMIMVRLLAFRPLASESAQDDATAAPPASRAPAPAAKRGRGSATSSGARASVPRKDRGHAVAASSSRASASGRDESSTGSRASASEKDRGGSATSSGAEASAPAKGRRGAAASSDSGTPTPDQGPAAQDNGLTARWTELVEKLGLRGLPRDLADACSPMEWTEKSLVLLISPSRANLLDGPAGRKLKEALQSHLGESAQLRFDIEKYAPGDGPAQRAVKKRKVQQQKDLEDFRQDATVQSLVDMFDGQIDGGEQ